MGEAQQNRHSPGVHREYRDDRIAVQWRPEICMHAAHCLRALPGVFNARARPWVDLSAADVDSIASTIARCPSGALSFERLDGGPQEEVPDTTSIEPQPGGPYYVRGRLEIVTPGGERLKMTRAALCRCGHSENKPFCDMMHRVVRFQG